MGAIGSVPDAGNWQHIAISRDNNQLRVFVNGIHRASTSIPFHVMPTSGSQLTFGRYLNSFNGQIDRIRVFVGDTPYRGTDSFTPRTSNP